MYAKFHTVVLKNFKQLVQLILVIKRCFELMVLVAIYTFHRIYRDQVRFYSMLKGSAQVSVDMDNAVA